MGKTVTVCVAVTLESAPVSIEIVVCYMQTFFANIHITLYISLISSSYNKQAATLLVSNIRRLSVKLMPCFVEK